MRARTVFLLALLSTVSAAAKTISFSKDIQPILQSSCWKCHGASIQLSKLDLRTREAALKGGEKGPAVIPGKAEESRLFRLVSGIEKPAMPMDGKLTAEQVAAIKDWIDQGAQWDNSTAAAAAVSGPSEDMAITPEMKQYWAFQKPARRRFRLATGTRSTPSCTPPGPKRGSNRRQRPTTSPLSAAPTSICSDFRRRPPKWPSSSMTPPPTPGKS